MRTSFGLIVAAALAAVLTAPRSAAQADAVSAALGCSGDPCVVKGSPGGELGAFRAAAEEIKNSGRRVVIDGPCNSACAILADMARGNVCLTKRARFGFHQGYVVGRKKIGGPLKLLGRFKPEHSSDIAGWVSKHGGYPRNGFRVMGNGSARKIWKGC